MAIRQGQHVRMRITGTKYVANSLDLNFHISNTLEDATTKDTADSNGLWQEFEKTKYNVDGSITAIVSVLSPTAVSDATGMTAADIKSAFSTEGMAWALMMVSGTQNRQDTGYGVICSGSKMTFSSVEVSAPKDGYAQLTANFTIYGGITVGSD